MQLPDSPHSVRDSQRELFSAPVSELGRRWRDSADRPRVDPATLGHWKDMLLAWVEDATLPLLIRKHRKNRGHRLEHKSGRILVPCDNAPANWIFFEALLSRSRQPSDFLEDLVQHRLPLAQVRDRDAHYRGCLRASSENLNTLGWKICHIADVGLGGRGSLTIHNLKDLKAHFLRFLDPANMILVPLEFGGLAECEQFLAAFKDPPEAVAPVN